MHRQAVPMQSVTWVNGTQQAHHAHTVVVGRRCPVVRSKHHTFEPTLRTHHDAHWTFGTSFVFQRLHTAIGDAKFGQGKHFSTENFLHFIGAQHAADRSMWKNNPKEGLLTFRAGLSCLQVGSTGRFFDRRRLTAIQQDSCILAVYTRFQRNSVEETKKKTEFSVGFGRCGEIRFFMSSMYSLVEYF